MTGAFSVEVLSEKLIKLNASQQSIETLSHWCIYHRKRAKQIVKTWEKEFFSAPKEKRVSFLYLANDIIQNSRRKGSEFVSEFWKVLSNALKDVKENGDETGRNAVSRLVNIWEERKVFGSRAQSLRETLLGNNPVPDFDSQEKEKEKEKEKTVAPSNSIKIKLDGSMLEKVAKAFKEVNDGVSNEEATTEECNSTNRRIEALVKEVTSHIAAGEKESETVTDELMQQQGNLLHLVEQLEVIEKNRTKLVTHLKEALLEQERKLETMRKQIQGFRFTGEQVANFREHLALARSTGPSLIPPPPVQSMAPIDEGNKKPKEAPSAAEFAAKLAASTSSAAMLSSLLSSLTPEETAALGFHSDKRQRLETTTSEGGVVYPESQHQQQHQHQQQQQQQQQQYLLPSVMQQPQYLPPSSMGMPYPYSGVVPPPPPPPLPPGRPAGVQVPIQQHSAQQMSPQQQQISQQIPQSQQIPMSAPQIQPPPLPSYHSLPPGISYYPTQPPAQVPR